MKSAPPGLPGSQGSCQRGRWKARIPFLLRKAPENEEDEEERAELNQSEDAETAENAAGGP